jgi:hypothetical protein
MRDIRTDLRDRLMAVMGRISDEHDQYLRAQEKLECEHRQEQQMLERERRALEALLAIEPERDGVLPQNLPPPRPVLPLGEFLTTKLHAHGAMDKDELRVQAEDAGYFNDVTNGRTFHTTLMNFVKHGKIIQLPDGRYAYPTRAPNKELFADRGETRRLATQ